MTKKIVVPYTQIENLDALLSIMVSPDDEESSEVTIVRLLTDVPVESEQLYSELKAVSAQIQNHPNWHVKVSQPSPIV